ncbi:MAG TPA: ABC transporter permease [Terriglobales bacterium]|nr:ABC transporter permease [Terriglobales bacterium]
MDTILQDIRYGFRMLLKSPAFTAVAVITLALGIGANTAIFSVVNAVMLRSMPFPQANRLMAVYHSYPDINLMHASVDPGNWDYYRQNVKSFSNIAAYSGYKAPQNLTSAGDPERVRTFSVTGDFFQVLGINPTLGRALNRQDDQPGANREVVLGYGLWKERFGGDRNIVGKDIALDGMNYTVVGVMPSGFTFPEDAQLWVPFGFTSEQLTNGAEYLEVVGRLRDDASPNLAKAEFEKITAEAHRKYPDLPPTFHITTAPLQEVFVGDISKPLWVLLGAVGLVLLIACVNVANLLLARATVRQRELSIRVALGATRLRIIRQLLTEGVLLALAGGAVGLFLGYWGIDLLLSIVPMELPSFVKVSVDSSVLLFTIGASILSGLLFGSIPAWHVSGSGLNDSLKEGGRTAAPGRHGSRRVLVVSEIALAMVLLVGAGLMIKSFVRILQSDPGFNAQNTLTATLSLPESKYKDEPKIGAFYREAAQRIATIPGVSASGLSSMLPMSGGWTNTFFVRGRAIKPAPHAYVAVASGTYDKAVQIPLQRGRFVADSDTPETQPVAVVDENAAKMYWPNEDPIGKQIALTSEGTPEKPVWRQIVGIVGSVRHRSAVGEETKGQIYLPMQQNPLRTMRIVVRTSGDPTQMAAAVRNEIRQIDREQPIFQVRTMSSLYNDFVAQPRFNMVLLAVFAGLALLLATVGIYAVMSYSVTQLTHEIGVRMALGAKQRDVLNMVLGQAARMAGFGLAVGLAGALLATRVLQTLLFGVRAYDIGTFALIGFLLASVALLASFLPALRATRVDPMVALRYE